MQEEREGDEREEKEGEGGEGERGEGERGEEISYLSSGVSRDADISSVKEIEKKSRATNLKNVLGGIGGFSGLYEFYKLGYKKPVLVSGTDGVGSKLKVAIYEGKHETIGIDLVAMCVNDILTSGAKPLFFLDYIALNKLDVDEVSKIMEGIVGGCIESDMALLGGETAQMPSMYKASEYDLAGFAVGVVEYDERIDGKDIVSGDIILGIRSSGFHSNGYSLIRKIVFERSDYKLSDTYDGVRSIGEVLLEPTRIYYKELLKIKESKIRVKGLAHITGGGIRHNIERIIPDNLCIELKQWDIPGEFVWLQRLGGLSIAEMYKTFNMGIGMAMVVDYAEVDKVIKLLGEDDIIEVGRVL